MRIRLPRAGDGNQFNLISDHLSTSHPYRRKGNLAFLRGWAYFLLDKLPHLMYGIYPYFSIAPSALVTRQIALLIDN